MKGLTPRLGIKRFHLIISILAGLASFIVLTEGIVIPPQNIVISAFAAIGIGVTLYYTQLLVYGLSIPAYILLTFLNKLSKQEEPFEDNNYTQYYMLDEEEDVISWDMGNTGESYAVIQSIKTLAIQVSGKSPYVGLLVVSPNGSVIYTENDDIFDDYISDSLLEEEEEKFEKTHLVGDGKIKPGIRIVRESRDNRDALLVVMDKNTFVVLSELVMKAGTTLVLEDLRSLEVIYNLVKELVKVYGGEELTKALLAYSTVKLLRKLERMNIIEIDKSLRKNLPLEDKATVLLVNKQIQEEERLKTDRRSR